MSWTFDLIVNINLSPRRFGQVLYALLRHRSN